MTELTQTSRDLLDGARAPSPDRATRARMRAAVIGVVAPGAVLASGAAQAGFFSSVAGKVLVGAVAVAVGASGTLATHRLVVGGHPPPTPRVATAKPAPLIQAPPPVARFESPPPEAPAEVSPGPAPPAPAAPAALAQPAAAQRVAAEQTAAGGALTAPAPAPSVEPAPSPPIAARPEAPPVESAARERNDLTDRQLREELSVLQQAMAYRDAADWSGVLAALEVYRARFSAPKLSVEATALEVLALCGQDRVGEARELGRRLAAMAPRSPALRGLSSSCIAE